LSKVEQYISQNFQENMTIEDLAHIANLSKSQLNRQFKNIFQMTPLQLIHKKRFDLAISLLSQDISITEISLKCGYSDHSAFSRKFKEVTQMSPSEFKERVYQTKS
jgi:AraC-like DNA-binding protein